MKLPFLFIIPVVVVSACIKQVNPVVGDSRVVVDCVLTEDPQQVLYLSLTNGVSGIGPNVLEGAVATLRDLTAMQTAGTFVRGPEGFWTLDYAALPEHTYRLEVEVPGNGVARAEDTMPPAVDVSYARGDDYKKYEVADTSYFYHYYDVLVEQTGIVYTFEIPNVCYQSASLPDHLLIQGFVYDEQSGRHKISEMMCTDSPGVDNANLIGSVYESEYYESVGTYIEEGSHEKKSYVTKGKLNPHLDGVSCHREYLRIEKRSALDQEFFTISGNFRMGEGFGDFPRLYGVTWNHTVFIPRSETHDYLLFTSLSDNYCRYLDDAAILRKRSESKRLSDLYMREAPFSNIEGGVGIFGATTKQILPVTQLYTPWEMYWE